jgi:predicted SAM-dependent methyltransferase
MDRLKKILKKIDRTGFGIEIGPSHNPVAPKKEGYNVEIIDHMNREQLVAKYKGHGVALANIEEVDYVWRGEKYAELTGKSKHYDWIIASHVIEHSPDLIGFLLGCDGILKDDGVVSLVVPDKRFCFDHYRPITGLGKIIDAHLSPQPIHSAGNVAEYFLNVVSKAGNIAWGAESTGAYACVHSTDDARQGIKSVVEKGAYVDIHAWCFVPHSFRLLVDDLFNLGLISFRELEFFPTTGCEFYITLGRGGRGPGLSRLELLDEIERELRNSD